MNTIQPHPVLLAQVSNVRLADAYRVVEEEIVAMKDDDVESLSVDIPTAFKIVLGSCERIRPHRDELARRVPTLDMSRFDKLGVYAWAMLEAYNRHKTMSEGDPPILALASQAFAVRELLTLEAEAQVFAGMFDAEEIDDLLGTNAHLNVATDVTTLISVFRRHATKIAGRTSQTAESLDAHADVAARLLEALSLRTDSGATALALAKRNRDAAFTLCFRAYREVQRAIQLIRFYAGDASELMPPFHQHPNAKRRASAQEETRETDPAPIPAPIVAPPIVPVKDAKPAPVVGGETPDNDPFGLKNK